jgi:hypothetical protein
VILLYLSDLRVHLRVKLFGDAMTDALRSNDSPGADRLNEIAEILAAGLIRLRQRKSTRLSHDRGEISLDFSVDQRGHVAPNPNVGAAE